VGPLQSVRCLIGLVTTNATRRIAAGAIILATIAIGVNRLAGGWDGLFYLGRLFYLNEVLPLTWPRDTFTPEAWKQTPKESRYRLAKSLLSSDQLRGRTPSEVDRLIGGMRADRLGCLDQLAADGDCTYLLRKVDSDADVRRVQCRNVVWDASDIGPEATTICENATKKLDVPHTALVVDREPVVIDGGIGRRQYAKRWKAIRLPRGSAPQQDLARGSAAGGTSEHHS
jgi:hypothetical protein